MIFIYFFKIFLPISQSFLLNPEKVSKKLISDNATLNDANSNALEGGGYHRNVRMVLDRGGSADPQKSVIYYLNAP